MDIEEKIQNAELLKYEKRQVNCLGKIVRKVATYMSALITRSVLFISRSYIHRLVLFI
jgi:hypothetical protein